MTHNSISTISGTPRTNGRSLSRRQDCKSWSARRSSADRRSHSMDASHAETWDAIYAKLFPGNPPAWLATPDELNRQLTLAGFTEREFLHLDRSYRGGLWAR